MLAFPKLTQPSQVSLHRGDAEDAEATLRNQDVSAASGCYSASDPDNWLSISASARQTCAEQAEIAERWVSPRGLRVLGASAVKIFLRSEVEAR